MDFLHRKNERAEKEDEIQAYVSVRQHTEKTELGEKEDEDLSERTEGEGLFSNLKSEGMHACVPLTSAYVSIRQSANLRSEGMHASRASVSE